MKSVRQPWMIRAAILMVVIGLTLGAWTIFVIWGYREVRPIAPDWLVREGSRRSPLDMIFQMGWMVIGAVWAIVVWSLFSKVLRIPEDAILVGPERENYPFHKRKLSRRAQTQAGQEGFVGEMTQRFGAFAQSPLTPPVRKQTEDPD